MSAAETFQLTPRRRLIGLSFGGMRSARRGTGSDMAGSRPYRPGDDIDTIDWAASARLSTARGTEEFVVRERFAEEAPRVVIVADRRPGMELFPDRLPWLSKPVATRTAALMIADSTVAARGYSGYLDLAEGDVYWRPPRSQHEDWRLQPPRPFGAPEDSVTRSLEHLLELRPSLPHGSFIFVLSDFLPPLEEEMWLRAVERRWDVIPVILQDAVWERSFPDVSGSMVPVVDPTTGRMSYLRLTRTEALGRRHANEARWHRLLRTFSGFDLDPVIVEADDPASVLVAFVAWSEHRQYWRGRR